MDIENFPYKEFRNVVRIARGGFSKVYKADLTTGNAGPVALKCIYKECYGSQDILLHELRIIKELNHDNVSKFYGVTTDSKERYALVLEYANGGNLREYLKKKLDWKRKIQISEQITRGLSYIHENGIVHRDLHSKNILIHDDKIKIADFGLSKSLNSTSVSFKGGMAGYTDPIYLKNERNFKREKPSDIYSLGVLFWEISSDVPPSKSHVINDNRENSIDGTPLEYVALYSYAWHESIERRPDIQTIGNFLKDICLKLVYKSSFTLFDDTFLNGLHKNFNLLPSNNQVKEAALKHTVTYKGLLDHYLFFNNTL